VGAWRGGLFFLGVRAGLLVVIGGSEGARRNE